MDETGLYERLYKNYLSKIDELLCGRRAVIQQHNHPNFMNVSGLAINNQVAKNNYLPNIVRWRHTVQQT